MQIERYRDRFKDVIALVVTPMDRTYAVDEGALRAQIDWCFAHGATGIVATGSIGEFLHLEDDERRARARGRARPDAQARRQHRAFAMTSGATTLQALRWTRTAAELGYDCAVVIAPYYWKIGEREALDHFRTVAETGLLPVCVYHNPALSKFHMSPAFFRRVAELENVVVRQRGRDRLAASRAGRRRAARTARSTCRRSART